MVYLVPDRKRVSDPQGLWNCHDLPDKTKGAASHVLQSQNCVQSMDKMTFKAPVQTYLSHKSFLCVEWNIGVKPPANFDKNVLTRLYPRHWSIYRIC